MCFVRLIMCVRAERGERSESRDALEMDKGRNEARLERQVAYPSFLWLLLFPLFLLALVCGLEFFGVCLLFAV